MKLEILTIFWGKSHFELFQKALLKSFKFKRNLEALKGSTWNIITDQDQDKVIELIPKEMNYTIRSSSDFRTFCDATQNAMVWQTEECLKNKARLLIAPPDTIFGNGTISNLIEAARQEKTCVVVPHPRVTPQFLDTNEELWNKSNQQLLGHAWKYLHRSWSDAEDGHPLQNSFVGGVVWKEIEPSLIEVRHYLPTVYLADFTKEDLDVFKSMSSFGSYDHEMPSKFVHEGRQRYVTSSDACFIVEVTEEAKNVPPIWSGATDSFWRSHRHNQHNAQIYSYFKL